MGKGKTFLILVTSFLLGIFCRSFWEFSSLWQLILLLLAICLLVVFYRNRKAALAAFIFISFAFGSYRVNSVYEKINNLNNAIGDINTTGLVLKSSENIYGQDIVLRIPQMQSLILIQVPQYPEYTYGDELQISCKLAIVENKNSDFDYKMFLAKDGVFYKCEKEKVVFLTHGKGNFIYHGIFKIRDYFKERLQKLLPQPEAALADGILFGGSEGLSQKVKDDFSKTGMTHIVAVSGYNVTIIAQYLILFAITIGLWRKQATLFAIVGIAIFVLMIGLPASAVRAGVMCGVILWAMRNGRLAKSFNAIAFAAAIMLIINPLLLRYDIGFQLSFLATLGIVSFSPLWEKVLQKYKTFGFLEILLMSLSAQLFVLPIITYNFKQVSLISLLANLLVLPIIPLSMLLVFLTCIAMFFWPLATFVAWFAFLPLLYEIKIIEILASFKWASMELRNVSALSVALYYCALVSGLLYFRYKKQKNIFENVEA
jgi:competence protein ComEC